MGGLFSSLILTIEGKELRDGVDINLDELASTITKETDAKTAAVTIGELEEA